MWNNPQLDSLEVSTTLLMSNKEYFTSLYFLLPFPFSELSFSITKGFMITMFIKCLYRNQVELNITDVSNALQMQLAINIIL